MEHSANRAFSNLKNFHKFRLENVILELWNALKIINE